MFKNFRIFLSPEAGGGAAPQDIVADPRNPNFASEIVAEIKKYGDNTKELYGSLRTDFEGLKSALANSADKGTVAKLTEAISAKQAALDAANGRIDAVETAMQRKGGAVDGGEVKTADVEYLAKSILAAKGGGGSSFSQFESASAEFSPKFYSDYCKSFGAIMRKGAEFVIQRQLIDAKTLSTTQDPDGGYTVTPAMATQIIQRLFESDPVRQLASSQTISTSEIEWLVDWDEAGTGWEGELIAGAATDTPQLKKRRIPVSVEYAKPQASQVLLEDSAINIEAWLAGHISRKFERTEAAAFVSGNGINKPRGFLTYSSGTTYGTVEQVALGHASALTSDGFTKLLYSLKEPFIPRATFLMNRLTVRDAMLLKDGDGQYLWRPGLAAGQPATILGAPVRMSTTMPVVAANALSVAVADWAEAYMTVDRLGITIQRDPYTVKPLVEFYTRKRVGGDVLNFDAIKIGIVST